MSRLSIKVLLPCLLPSEEFLGWQSCSIVLNVANKFANVLVPNNGMTPRTYSKIWVLISMLLYTNLVNVGLHHWQLIANISILFSERYHRRTDASRSFRGKVVYLHYMFVSLLAIIYCIRISCINGTAIIQTSCILRWIVFVLVRSMTVIKLYLDSMSNIWVNWFA